MVAATDKKLNKTAFITGFLTENPSANHGAVTDAWTKAGNSGTISTTLVSNIRNDLGLAGNLRGPSKRAESNAGAGATKAKTRTAQPKKAAKAKSGAGALSKRGLNDRTEISLVSGATPKSQGKSSFVKELLFDNPLANTKTVNAAWTKAGMEGKISDSLVSAIKSGLGLTRKHQDGSKTPSGKVVTRTAKAKSPNQATFAASGQVNAKSNRTQTNGTPAEHAPARKARMTDRERLLAEIEGDIDHLMFKLMHLGGLEAVEDALRSARRVVVRSHEG